MFRCCSPAEFPCQGKNNMIWPVHFVNPRTFGRTMWLATGQRTLWLPLYTMPATAGTQQKKGHRFHNLEFLICAALVVFCNSFQLHGEKENFLCYCNEWIALVLAHLKFSVEATVGCRTKFCQFNFGMPLNFESSYVSLLEFELHKFPVP